MAPLGEHRKQSDNVEASFGAQLHAGPQKNTHIVFNGSKLYDFFWWQQAAQGFTKHLILQTKQYIALKVLTSSLATITVISQPQNNILNVFDPHTQTSIQTNVISQSRGGDDQTLSLRDQAGGLLSLVCVGGY